MLGSIGCGMVEKAGHRKSLLILVRAKTCANSSGVVSPV
jgi:hypothetical protein